MLSDASLQYRKNNRINNHTNTVLPAYIPVSVDTGMYDTDMGQQDNGCTWKMDVSLNINQLKQSNPLGSVLSALQTIPGISPNLMRIETILQELFSNAVDHGVLGLSSALKMNAAGFKEFYQLREQTLAKASKGLVHIHLAYFAAINGGTLLISMQDSGNGFDYQRYFGFTASTQNGVCKTRAAHMLPYGRGLMLVHSLCESLRFFGSGNQVVARVSWKTAH